MGMYDSQIIRFFIKGTCQNNFYGKYQVSHLLPTVAIQYSTHVSDFAAINLRSLYLPTFLCKNNRFNFIIIKPNFPCSYIIIMKTSFDNHPETLKRPWIVLFISYFLSFRSEKIPKYKCNFTMHKSLYTLNVMLTIGKLHLQRPFSIVLSAHNTALQYISISKTQYTCGKYGKQWSKIHFKTHLFSYTMLYDV